MKCTVFFVVICGLWISACRKDNDRLKGDYMEVIRVQLADSLTKHDFKQLDFDRAERTQIDSVQLFFFRIPFRGMDMATDFVMLQTNKWGKLLNGRIIHLKGRVIASEEGTLKRRKFQGTVSLYSLNRQAVIHSPVHNGFITAFNNDRRTRTELVEPGSVLPEVIIVYTKTTESSYDYNAWYHLLSFAGGGSNTGGYYGTAGGSLTFGIGGGGYTGSYGTGYTSLIQVDREVQGEDPAIEVATFVRCFDAIPDGGSSCSIEIMTDIPVDRDPMKLLDVNTGSPGHVFVNLRKSNGTYSVSQNIGFYPVSGWKTTITNAPIAGKFVDNGNHEFNASLKMALSPADFRSTLTEMLYLARFIQYDIDEYNCMILMNIIVQILHWMFSIKRGLTSWPFLCTQSRVAWQQVVPVLRKDSTKS